MAGSQVAGSELFHGELCGQLADFLTPILEAPSSHPSSRGCSLQSDKHPFVDNSYTSFSLRMKRSWRLWRLWRIPLLHVPLPRERGAEGGAARRAARPTAGAARPRD